MAPTVRRIQVPLPFALQSANCWLFPGHEPVLVDCGIGTPEAYAALLAGLRDAGVDPVRLRLLVTHGHVDHAGNAARLRREFGVPLWAPAAESAFIETFRRDAGPRNEEFMAALRAHGVPSDVVRTIGGRSQSIDLHLEDTSISRPVRDGDAVRLGDHDARLRLAPGHTPGSILLETADNQLVSGDTLLEHITSNAIELRDADRGRYRTYLDTLAGLQRYVGCEVLPGHHAPFILTDAVLDGHLAKHHRRRARVLEQLDVPRTAWEILPRVLPHLAPDQTFLGMCEVVGHLNALDIDGLVGRKDDAGGVRRFVRV
ncbi:MAG TPA: MBL fold metallo-hydrolase [Candidatus Thermoplasmatota archaeon]|nr:MBL fold metallo-hydrolase [Candidatus Thermoplasmatota archaeon]